MEEYVPMQIPNVSTTPIVRMEAPPIMPMIMHTKRVVRDVIIVRDSVWLMDTSIVPSKSSRP